MPLIFDRHSTIQPVESTGNDQSVSRAACEVNRALIDSVGQSIARDSAARTIEWGI